MEVNDLMERKSELESKILEFVSNEMKSFRRDTGVPIKDLSIYFTDITTVSDEVGRIIPSNVEARIDI